MLLRIILKLLEYTQMALSKSQALTYWLAGSSPSCRVSSNLLLYTIAIWESALQCEFECWSRSWSRASPIYAQSSVCGNIIVRPVVSCEDQINGVPHMSEPLFWLIPELAASCFTCLRAMINSYRCRYTEHGIRCNNYRAIDSNLFIYFWVAQKHSRFFERLYGKFSSTLVIISHIKFCD